MRIAVIGAGIVGTATAFELAQDGHEVVVLDRHGGVAAESSFAPAALGGASGLAPWGAFGFLPGALLGLSARGSGGSGFHPAAFVWRWRARRALREAASRALSAPLHALAQFSQAHAQTLRGKFQMDFERTRGVLLPLRSAREVEQADAGLERLRALGARVQLLDAAGCHAIEPALNRERPLAGGLHLPDDETANCRQFAHLLRDGAERAGVEFRFGSVVRAIEPDSPPGIRLRLEQMALTTGFEPSRLAGPRPQGGPSALARRARAAARYLEPVSQEQFDAVVVAAGAGSAEWLPALGLAVPLLPVQGISVTASLRSPERGPQATLVDAVRQAVVMRLGQRVRVAGGCEPGSASEPRRATVESLYAVLNDWFPGCAHLARPQVWKGARPMLVDGPPVIGTSPRPGVWLNIGHGNSGWALACGSARLLADQIGGRAAAVDASAFSASRYAKV